MQINNQYPVYTLLEMDREHHRKKLDEGTQYCDYCGKKLLKDPNRQKTFCGIPVRKD